MQPNMVGYVDAVFDASNVRMKIDRDKFPAFESVLHQPVYQTFTKFAGGLWDSSDLQATLAFALIDWNDPYCGEDLRRQANSQRQLAEFLPDRKMGFQIPVAIKKKVTATLIRNPPGPYAGLALKILEAALFGIPEKDARFDEGKLGEAA